MAAKQRSLRVRHVPQRTCIACRRVEAKRQFVRLVRVAENAVAVDPTGKQDGRGAYLCSERPCWDPALKRGAIERALRVELSAADRTMLDAYAAQLPDASSAEDAMN